MSGRWTARWLLAGFLAAGAARGAPADEVRVRVNGLLGSYRPVTVAEWRALGPAAAPALEAVARDAGALPTRRARALAALGVVQPTAAAPLVRVALVSAVASAGWDRRILRWRVLPTYRKDLLASRDDSPPGACYPATRRSWRASPAVFITRSSHRTQRRRLSRASENTSGALRQLRDFSPVRADLRPYPSGPVPQQG